MKLNQVIASFLREIAKAQASSDAYAQQIKDPDKRDSFLKVLPIPKVPIKEIKLDLKYVILKGKQVSNWVIGGRKDRSVVAINIHSKDSGQTLIGRMKYIHKVEIAFRARNSGGNNYIVENQWGSSDAPWHKGGTWVIGDRATQRVVALNLTSKDGKVLNGTVTYNGEYPINITCALPQENATSEQLQNVYIVNYVASTDDLEEVEVEVLTDNLNNYPESMLSSISLTLDMDNP